MNNRLIKLALDAGVLNYVDNETPRHYFLAHWCDEVCIEDFAKLIVQECARIVAQTPCPYEDEFAKQTYGHTWDMACVESAKNIREHFEIK